MIKRIEVVLKKLDVVNLACLRFIRSWLTPFLNLIKVVLNKIRLTFNNISGGSTISQTEERGANPISGGKNLLFSKIFAKNCMEIKEIVIPDAPPPWIRQWASIWKTKYFKIYERFSNIHQLIHEFQLPIEINGNLHYAQIWDGKTSCNFTQGLEKKRSLLQIKILKFINFHLFLIFINI